MGGFEELGKRLDKLAEKVKSRTQEEAEKAGVEIKEWGKRLDELGEKIKKITQEGVEKVSGETKGIVQITKLRSEIREIEKDIDTLTKQLGVKTYQLHLENKIGNVELKKLGGKITQFKKDIEAKEKGIQRLREK
ncbi:hypothetical protein CEE35_09035 [Candidatus Aerophobetes bacterium Ae_b3b]|nr:MAG: hypothetical protein CEE35_09035 [Candidatus Aerophobetes bacterium Ae_b3b]